MNVESHIAFYSFKDRIGEFTNFLDAYYPEKIMFPPDEPIRDFIPRELRVCRFCNQPQGVKRFRKDAHIIPNFLGNKYLISDFECDDCNAVFSEYENDFANWLGIIRSISKTEGKSGVPTFKSPRDKVTARLVDFYNNKVTKVSTQNSDGETLKYDPETGEVVINYTKASYTPIKVYKAFLKIALSMIASENVEQYRPTFKFLLDEAENPSFKGFAKVICHYVPTNQSYSQPFAIMFKKINQDAKLPQHTFLLYYETYIYGFTLPFSAVDIKAGHYKDNYINMIWPPPILFVQPHDQSNSYAQIKDFSGTEKIKNEVEVMSFRIPPEILDNLTSFDPKTGVSKSCILNPNEIAGLYLVPTDLEIKLKTDS
jgi:hypothetical protein